MDGRKKSETELMKRLSRLMSKGDAETIVAAALRPQDFMARKMTELIWESLPAEAKANLGDTVDTFLSEAGQGGGAELISPNAQKQQRQRDANA